MVRNEMAPYLRQRFGVRDFGCSLCLRFVGVGQSQIDQTIKEHVAIAPDVTVTSLFEGSRVDFTFSLPGDTPADQARLKRLEANIREHLNEYFYADDGSSLEEVVVRKLLAHGGPLALAEIGSGGHLAAALNGVVGTDRLLIGAYAAPTEAAMARLLEIPPDALSLPGVAKAKAVASAAAKRLPSKWTIATGPIESDGQGAKHIWVAWQSPEGHWDSQRVVLRDSGDSLRSGLVTQVLDRLRRQLR
jgi:nicotinamide-nucleotide amidase